AAVADLQYRDAYEYAVGHNVATRTVLGDGQCREVETRWLPTAEVERVAPADIAGVELGMEAIAALADAAEAKQKLGNLVALYRQWIDGQRGSAPTTPKKRKDTAKHLLDRAAKAADRIEDGIKLLEQADVFEAFRLANRVMAAAARRRRLMEGV